MNLSEQFEIFSRRGWVVVPDVFPDDLINQVKNEFHNTKHIYNFYHDCRGVSEEVAFASHHTHLTCPTMWDLVDNDVLSYFVDSFFGGAAILNTMGLSEVTSSGVYTQKIHRDVRSPSSEARLYLNTLIMLDDSTAENGATWIMENSGGFIEPPSQAEFEKNAVRACGTRGSLLVFDCDLWHRAGVNQTDRSRHIITPFFSRPFIKQQLDLPRAYGEGFGECISSRLKQWMGYNARVPVTLGEFYQKLEDRFYQPNQG